jgi:hypothetical protein
MVNRIAEAEQSFIGKVYGAKQVGGLFKPIAGDTP